MAFQYILKVGRAGLLGVLVCACLNAQAIELVTEDDPPNNMLRADRVVGISTEKLAEAFKRSGIPFHVTLMPCARAYRSALEESDVCVYSTARTEQRERQFRWVGPLATMDWVLYTRADNPVRVTRLEDVRGEVIGGYAQDVISLWLVKNGYRVDTGAGNESNPTKLLRHRFDYWADSKSSGSELLKKQGLRASIVPVLTFGHTDLYLACNPAVSIESIAKLNQALADMKRDGTIGKIDARYAQ